jgi:hypothetical protein
MITIGILERDDVIGPTDYMRCLEIEYTGQSDYVATRSCYSGSPKNYFRWLMIKDAGIDYFMGKTVGEFEDAIYGMEKPHQPIARHEFARGLIPDNHMLRLEKRS